MFAPNQLFLTAMTYYFRTKERNTLFHRIEKGSVDAKLLRGHGIPTGALVRMMVEPVNVGLRRKKAANPS